nr:hypothetical protein [Streptomyces chartreusis]
MTKKLASLGFALLFATGAAIFATAGSASAIPPDQQITVPAPIPPDQQ